MTKNLADYRDSPSRSRVRMVDSSVPVEEHRMEAPALFTPVASTIVRTRDVAGPAEATCVESLIVTRLLSAWGPAIELPQSRKFETG